MQELTAQPIVSIVMITYGHESFILDAIKGVLNQNFADPIEFIISNDRSPDNTDTLIRQFFSEEAIPSNISIRYYHQEKNLGANQNFIWTIEQAKGKYIAICEGDDFWIHPEKLAIQVSFLDENPSYSIVFSNTEKLWESGDFNDVNEMKGITESREYLGEEIIDNWIAHTSTYLFRNDSFVKGFKSFFGNYRFIYGDTPLFLYLLNFGKSFGFIERFSTYRRHEGGLTNRALDLVVLKAFIGHLESIKKGFSKKSYDKVLNKQLFWYNFMYANHLKGNSSKKITQVFHAISYSPSSFFKSIFEKIDRLKSRTNS